MSDQMVIERLRRDMREQVDGMQPRPETLERVLSSPPRRTPSLGWLMPALAVGVAAVVAVVAVTSLSHRAPAPRGTTSGVPVGARGLASRLAVLRGAQRPDDVLPGWAVRETESLTDQAKVVGALSRLVGSVNLGAFGRARVYLVVQRPPHFPVHRKHPGAPLLNPRLGDQASIAFIGSFRDEAAISPRSEAAGGPAVAATRHGLTADPGQLSYLSDAGASIVPDGVTRVKWVFTPTGTDSGLPPITVWPKLRENVAIGRRLPVAHAYLSSAVWYGADGHVLQSFGAITSAPGPRNFKQALEMSLHDPVAPALLRHFHVLRSARRPGSPSLSQAGVASVIEPNPVDLNVARARSMSFPRLHAKVWVIPGTQGMAIRSEGALVGEASGGLSIQLSGDLFIEGARVSGHRTIIGLAPDGNRVITVLLPGGGRRTAPVKDNWYSIVVPANARWLLVRNAAGRIVRLRL